jgi:hypothetical protein
MSILAVTRALQQRLKPTQKLVLLVLAHRHHQKTGQCNPSLATLVADTGLSRSAIKAALRDLGALKLVRSINRKSAGRDLSNQYQLLFENTTGCQCTGAGTDPQRGRDPTPGRGLEALGSAADPMGPGAGPNKEWKRRKVPSQKEKRFQEERYRRGLHVVGGDDRVPDDPFEDWS